MLYNKNSEDQSYWISFTDLVSGFMVVFIVISLLSINTVQEKEQEIKEPIADTTEVSGRYKEFVENFQKIIEQRGWEAIEIADSATIRFSVRATSPSPLFEDGSSTPTIYFDRILYQFIPDYLSELYTLYSKQDSFSIREIRIEGHTDSRSNYLINLDLSSKRAYAVQQRLFRHPAWEHYDENFKKFVQKNSIACGYSYSRLLDKYGKYSTSPDMVEDRAKSRRVEFRILLDYQNKKQ
jgi:outer membrane protein OmpA-like peptidoglycan-associated protein